MKNALKFSFYIAGVDGFFYILQILLPFKDYLMQNSFQSLLLNFIKLAFYP